MSVKRVPCAFCKSPEAPYLCDFVIGAQITDWSDCTRAYAFQIGRLDEFVSGKGIPCTSTEAQTFTCDAPLCSRCRMNVGVFFACGSKGFYESVDYCPAHVNSKRDARPISEAEAEKIRRESRKTFKVVSSGE